MADPLTGGCACGAVRYTAKIDGDDAYLCHCRMCQRASGNVSLALTNAMKADVTWETEPARYRSSPIARRGFCAACGTSLTFEYDDSAKMDLTVASFDDPSRFRPSHHFGTESLHEAWLDTSALPRQPVDEYQPIIDKWIRAIGKLPD